MKGLFFFIKLFTVQLPYIWNYFIPAVFAVCIRSVAVFWKSDMFSAPIHTKTDRNPLLRSVKKALISTSTRAAPPHTDTANHWAFLSSVRISKYKEQAGLLTYVPHLPRLPKADTSVTSCGLLTITVTGSSRTCTGFSFNPLLELVPTTKTARIWTWLSYYNIFFHFVNFFTFPSYSDLLYGAARQADGYPVVFFTYSTKLSASGDKTPRSRCTHPKIMLPSVPRIGILRIVPSPDSSGQKPQLMLQSFVSVMMRTSICLLLVVSTRPRRLWYW